VSEPAPSNIQLADCASEHANENNVFTSTYISAEQFRGFPKALPRNKTKEGRQPGRSTIITDTPEKELIATKAQDINEKHVSTPKKKRVAVNFLKKPEQEDSSESEVRSLILDNESVSEESFSSFEELERKPGVDDYILVRFPKGVLYVTKIVSGKDEQGDFEVSYQRKSLSFEGPVLPNVPDIASVNESGIAQIAPQTLPMKTKRLSGYILFPFKFVGLDVR
jgi:hypothetical protein